MPYFTIIGGVFVAWLILALLVTPHIPYHIEAAIDARSDHFVHVLESTCQTRLEHGNRIDIFTNGDRFYPAMLDAIRQARETSRWSATSSKRANRRSLHRGAQRARPCRRSCDARDGRHRIVWSRSKIGEAEWSSFEILA
jgi:hypothetical protein